MDDLEKYLNDPDLINEPIPVREVHAVRLMIQEETKGMTQQERLNYYRKSGEEAAKKYGFRRIESNGV